MSDYPSPEEFTKWWNAVGNPIDALTIAAYGVEWERHRNQPTLVLPPTSADKPPRSERDILVKHDEPCCPRNPSPGAA